MRNAGTRHGGLVGEILLAFSKKAKDLKQVRDLVIEVGRAHLSCALVEQQLHDLLGSFG
jgi:hypothetical protein